jgi:hypothetical protein
MSSIALVGWLVGQIAVTDVMLVLFVAAAGLESIFGYCLGCRVFAGLMRLGVVPEGVCLECADVGRRLRSSRAV